LTRRANQLYKAIIGRNIESPRGAIRGGLLIWDKVLGLGTTDPLAGFAAVTSNLVVSFYFAKRGFENVARIIRRWAMNEADIRAIVVETLAEQQRLQYSNIDAAVQRAVASILTSFGIEEEDRKELRADLQHLRRWRKSVEQAQSYTFKAVITVLVTGLIGAAWLGLKVMLGK
jgi:hypothetical protein